MREELEQRALLAIFDRFDPAEVESVLPLILLASGADVEEMSPPCLKIWTRFLDGLSLDRSAGRDAIQEAIAKHYREHPVNRALLSEVLRLVSVEPSDLIAAALDSA